MKKNLNGAKLLLMSIYDSSMCTNDNHSLLARGLSSRTHGRTMSNTDLVICGISVPNEPPHMRLLPYKVTNG